MVLPNLIIKLPLLLLGERPPLNLDYAALGLFAGLLGGWLTALGYALLVLLDGIVRFAPIFHFSIPSVAAGLAELFHAQPAIVGSLGIVAAIFLAGIGYSGAKLARLNEPVAARSRMALAGVAILIGGLDATNGTGEVFRAEHAWLNWNIAGSATWAVFCGVREEFRRGSRLEGDHAVRIPAASSQLFAAVEQHREYPRIAVVLVESWGQLLRPGANASVLAPVLSSQAISDLYEVHVGTTPFQGPTTAAEFRELCEWKGTYLSAPSRPTGRCLPELLRKQGYHTVAIHGFHPEFFDRFRWYPHIGFEKTYFDGDLRTFVGDRKCGSLFSGPCDEDAVKIVRRELLTGRSGQKKLVYWLTLSSHFPVDRHAAANSHFECADDPDAAKHAVVCILLSIWHRNFENIRNIALDPDLPPTRWLIVGDHRPPLLDSSESELFSPSVVPYIELIPRSLQSGEFAIVARRDGR